MDIGVERLLAEYLSSIGEGVHITDKDGTVIYVNQAFLSLHGDVKDDLGMSSYVGQKLSKLAEQNLSSTVVTTKILESSTPITNQPITYYTTGKNCIANGYPVILNGKLERVVTIVRDYSKVNLILNTPQKNNTTINRMLTEDDTTSDMLPVYRMAIQVAPYDISVLLEGETGSGKDYMAKTIHSLSGRIGNFIHINCAAIPESLLESELFGYEPGSFSGASKNGKIGLFESAKGGTVFLDEIGELPLKMQAKLLTVLQDKQVTRVGGTIPHPITARIIAATNQDLEKMIKEKTFREDLYYRLNVVKLRIPPLRERPNDLRYLIAFFLNKFNTIYNKRCTLSSETMAMLTSYSWPGNVRELQNMMERLVIFSDVDSQKDIINSNIRSHIESPVLDNLLYDEVFLHSQKSNETLKDMMHQFEAKLINEAIEKYGTYKAAAKALGLDVSTLRRKKNKFT